MPATVPHVAPAAGSYHLEGVELTDECCQGTACFVARYRDPDRWASGVASPRRVACLGQCHRGPARAGDDEAPYVEVHAADGIVLGRLASGGARTLDRFRAAGGFQAVEHALRIGPEAVLDEIDRSGLRGRGGAGFPTGRKWRAVAAGRDRGPVVVCNADEGDPGAYVDRYLLEEDPFTVLSAMVIAGLAVGAGTGYVYVRREYPVAAAVIAHAVDTARSHGLLGARVLGGGPPFDVRVVRGEGSYVCGEETALLNALEGRRPAVRVRPPFPAEHGLHGRPTLVQNVETLAAVPWIVTHGGAAYATLGAGGSRGTKVVCLNSMFRRPGLFEVEFGLPVRDVVEGLGGGLRDGALHGVLIGGPLAGVLPPHLLDTPFTFEHLRAVGASVGHGGVVAFDERTTALDLLHHAFVFGAAESCGTCTPCREGTQRIEALTAATLAGGTAPAGAADELAHIVAALGATSLCGHGSGLADLARSLARHYPEELTCLV